MAREFRVWNEVGDLFGVHRTPGAAERTAAAARNACRKHCRTSGKEVTPGMGDFQCGVLSRHGISIQVVEDGYDVTTGYIY